jgi:NCAIR mutase (PurE)-related protein
VDPKKIKSILEKIISGGLSIDEGARRLQFISFEDMGFAKLDHNRSVRTGAPEVIFAPGKTDRQIMKIFERMHKAGSDILISRTGRALYNKLQRKYKNVKYNDTAGMITKTRRRKRASTDKAVAIVTGGTSDLSVAEEAGVTIETFGGKVERIYDVGVAGIHRLLAYQDKLKSAAVVIVVAGMEGALPSVVGGLVTAPVIAVPTSIGYGASFGGIAALLAMLNSCAPGVTVVNIDNGFGAAMAALKMIGRNKDL